MSPSRRNPECQRQDGNGGDGALFESQMLRQSIVATKRGDVFVLSPMYQHEKRELFDNPLVGWKGGGVGQLTLGELSSDLLFVCKGIAARARKALLN